ncbi:hypothetical protein quinque_007128 [Culex quinquefasciatus]
MVEITLVRMAVSLARIRPLVVLIGQSRTHNPNEPHDVLNTIPAQLCRACLRTTKAKTVKKLFYQKLSISINELENKKQKKELILYPNKNGTVASLLAEAAKVIEFHETKLLRISELSKNRLAPGPAKDTPLEILVRQELERLE